MLFLIGILRREKMKIKYFNDTDTALVEFTENQVKETREISENIYIDLDADGNPVSMTIEHARITAHLPDITYQQIEKATAAR
jgi:uncharacterized protein YuzE